MRKLVGIIVIVWLLGLAQPLYADEISDLKRQMKAMQSQMQEMYKRIELLERGDKEKVAKIKTLETDLDAQKALGSLAPLEAYELGEGLAPFGEEGIALSGFSSVTFDKQERSESTFNLHHFNLYVDIPVGESFKAFGEIEFEDGGHFEAGATGEGHIHIERAWLDWYFKDWANLKVGLMLNPWGQWNIIHADPLLPTTTKPLMVNQGRMIGHMLGAEFFGSIFPHDWEINYHLGLANGKGPTPRSQDVNDDKMLFGRVEFVPPLGDLGDLKFGFGGMNAQDGSLGNANEKMVGADLTYYYGPFGIWAEWYTSWVYPPSATNFNADGFFVMGMYEFIDKWTAIVRYEQNDQNDKIKTSNYIDGQRWLWGVNYKPIPPVTFKLEYVYHDEERNDQANNTVIGSANVLF